MSDYDGEDEVSKSCHNAEKHGGSSHKGYALDPDNGCDGGGYSY